MSTWYTRELSAGKLARAEQQTHSQIHSSKRDKRHLNAPGIISDDSAEVYF